ncbi:cardiolipin synthase [Paenibacillus sp. HB172176]|uniref:cardiolipin synthase n=1 Tax=Paenibacillus sp. HB172176 TaxID=2493690 RepID=UPI001F0FB50B|nr:cardiolipin synthase [Paenibacillus sp. HB172176]
MWTGWLLSGILLLYISQFAVILGMERKRQEHLTAWIFIVMICPFIGMTAYLLVGRRISEKTRVKREEAIQQLNSSDTIHPVTTPKEMNNEEMLSQDRLFTLLSSLSPFPIAANNKTTVLTDGEATFDAILDALDKARQAIYLDYYTIRSDGIGGRFLQVLTRKAREGLDVRVIYDGIGSLKLGKSYLNSLRAAGVRTACFSPVRFSFTNRRLNFRNHRKIVIVDAAVGFIGGINIGDEYLGKDEKLGFWRDTHLRIDGDAVWHLLQLFESDWMAVASGAKGHRMEERASASRRSMPLSAGEERMLVVPGTPGVNHQRIVEVLYSAMTAAKKRIYASTPYFIPDPAISASLVSAARSGVDVRLIIPGVSDSKLVLLASLSYVQEMLEAGVRIYRYQKGFIHAKVLLIDHMLASVGSANLDMRSLYSNYELLVLLFDKKPMNRLERDFMNDLRHSKEIDLEGFKSRSSGRRRAEAIMHMLSPLL